MPSESATMTTVKNNFSTYPPTPSCGLKSCRIAIKRAASFRRFWFIAVALLTPRLWVDLWFRRLLCWFYDFIISLSPPSVFRFDLESTKAASKSCEESKSAADGSRAQKQSESEFISDKFKPTNARDLEEIQENMTKLGLTAPSTAEGKNESPMGKEVTWTCGRPSSSSL